MDLKVFLNCFPPTSLYMPSIGCQILSSYIREKANIESEVIYWNHLFQEKENHEDNLFQSDSDFYRILPFLAILTGQENTEVVNRILLKMQECNPSFKTLGENYYREKLSNQISRIYDTIEAEIEKLPTNRQLIFGISAKFDSWIPGIVVTKEVKKRIPSAICVLGGLEEKNAASILFKKYDVFDFAIWGEGEVPLNMLIESIKNNKNDFSDIPRLIFRSNPEEAQKTTEAIDKTGFIDLKDYPQIDYGSYFQQAINIDKKEIQLPIEISRGCRWNKCNFCALSWGNSYRTQNFEKVIDQIKANYQTHKIVRYFFVDNDIVGRNLILFEKFLDRLIDLSSHLEVDFDFHADILHLNFNKELIKKLSLAGFKSVQVGYEVYDVKTNWTNRYLKLRDTF
ncbi:B12-binding domain-containing radical SAM protein [Marinifilum caeruleilacunae]|uniref:Radical SAM protein n=1 Tax=Marinifilum caeruleilacunae TaxID=2499076 RepID=A0ABX1X1N8_9BACT|nr:hypothetical protein [Marinifilum caeruleilacunae]NOU62272.1 hypothetical protein [Marinifilum caeruleilacunae]